MGVPLHFAAHGRQTRAIIMWLVSDDFYQLNLISSPLVLHSEADSNIFLDNAIHIRGLTNPSVH